MKQILDSMQPAMVLGIESSCDETSAAVYSSVDGLLSNVIASQKEHSDFGGVVPEIASRAHTEKIVPVIRQSLSDAGIVLDDIDGVAVTAGPGLVGSLLVGVSAAKGLAWSRGLPLVDVHHIEAHVFANVVDHPDLEPPFLALIVSGGHTQLVQVPKWGEYHLLGNTRDDAAGEAFDKVAKLLDIGYPGGPLIDKLSRDADPTYTRFPKAFMKNDPLAFSFSGLKTAVLQFVEKLSPEELDAHRADIAACFQDAVVRALVDTTKRAIRKTRAQRLVMAGGVVSNTALRARMREACEKIGVEVYQPSSILCTDNAAMVACAGSYWLRRGRRASLDLNPDPRRRLTD